MKLNKMRDDDNLLICQRMKNFYVRRGTHKQNKRKSKKKKIKKTRCVRVIFILYVKHKCSKRRFTEERD